jgi:hypothetical protein
VLRLLKTLLTALFTVFAVIFGLVTAAAVAVAGVFIFMVQRLLRPKSISRLPNQRRARTSAGNTSDVIDITATEVSPDPSNR